MRIVLHGPLAKRFGRDHYIETQIPADAIEGLSRQCLDWPRDMLIDVIDADTQAKLFSPVAEGVEEIHLVPRMYGGGGKFGAILLGAALIATAILAPQLAVFGFALHTTLITAGVSLMLTGVMGLFMKAPTVSKSSDPPASKYLGINRNTTAIGTPRALAWGRVRLSGHWLSLQSDANKMVFGTFPASIP